MEVVGTPDNIIKRFGRKTLSIMRQSAPIGLVIIGCIVADRVVQAGVQKVTIGSWVAHPVQLGDSVRVTYRPKPPEVTEE
jgi:hypothetical protein